MTKPQVHFFTEEKEKEILEQKAREANLSLGEYVKRRALADQAISAPAQAAIIQPNSTHKPWPFNEDNQPECFWGYQRVLGFEGARETFKEILGNVELCPIAPNRPEMTDLEVVDLPKICDKCKIFQKHNIVFKAAAAEMTERAKLAVRTEFKNKSLRSPNYSSSLPSISDNLPEEKPQWKKDEAVFKKLHAQDNYELWKKSRGSGGGSA